MINTQAVFLCFWFWCLEEITLGAAKTFGVFYKGLLCGVMPASFAKGAVNNDITRYSSLLREDRLLSVDGRF